MKHWTKILVCLAVLLTPVMGRENPRLLGRVDFQMTGFDRTWGLTTANGFGAGVLVRFTPFFLTGVAIQSARTRQSFAEIGGEAFVDIRVLQVLLNGQVPLRQLPGGFVLSLVGGGGLLRLTRTARAVSLGAAGGATLPAVQRHFFSFQGGVTLSRPVRGRLGVVLSLLLQGVRGEDVIVNRLVQGGVSFDIL